MEGNAIMNLQGYKKGSSRCVMCAFAILILSLICTIARAAVTTQDVQDALDSYNYKSNWYWGSDSTLTNKEKNERIAVNGVPSSKYSYASNFQCSGFALYLGYILTGENPLNGAHWTKYTSLNDVSDLRVGDIVGFGYKRYNGSDSQHRAMVYSANGGTYTFVQAAGSNNNKISVNVGFGVTAEDKNGNKVSSPKTLEKLKSIYIGRNNYAYNYIVLRYTGTVNIQYATSTIQCSHQYTTVYEGGKYVGKCSKCNKIYDYASTFKNESAGVYQITSEYNLNSEPYQEAQTGIIYAAGRQINVVGHVINAHGSKWYKTSDGYYVYESWATLIQTTSTLSISPVKTSYTIQHGNSCSITGSITSNYNITKVTATLDGTQYVNLTPNAKSVNIGATNSGQINSFKGASLSIGTHYIVINATDSSPKTVTKTISITVTGSSTPSTYTVSYNANGGSGVPSAQTKTHDITLVLSTLIPTRTNYLFIGWAPSSTGSVQYQPGGNYTANANITLYAVWEMDTEALIIPSSVTLELGYRMSICEAMETPGNFSFSSSDTSVAKISSDGCVYGFGLGSCVITVTSKSNSSISAECDVTVITPNEINTTWGIGNTYYDIQSDYERRAIIEKFTPDKTCEYKLWSTGDTDTVCKVYNESWNMCQEDDDSGDGFNFSIKMVLYEGESYYIFVIPYSPQNNVTLRYYLDREAPEIVENRYTSVTIDESYLSRLYRFVPSESMSYAFYSKGEQDALGYIYDSGWNVMASNDDGGEGRNFFVTYDLVSGQTYYLETRIWSNGIGEYSVIITNMSGTCGEEAIWEYDEGVLKISGSGNMLNYSNNETPWNIFRERITHLIISDGITGIGDYAFAWCDNLSDIDFLASNLQIIGEGAFMGCGLEWIWMPDSISLIGKWAFYDCTMLEWGNIPSNASSTGIAAYENCTNLRYIYLPEGLTVIDEYCFRNCDGLIKISIPNTVTHVGSYAFLDCDNLESVAFMNEGTIIESGAIPYNGKVVLRGYIESAAHFCAYFGDYEFVPFSMTRSSFVLPSALKTIEAESFVSIDAKAIYIPEGVIEIKGKAFMNCKSLCEIRIPESVRVIQDDAFNDCKSWLIIYGKPNSIAQSYAEQHGFFFIDESYNFSNYQ